MIEIIDTGPLASLQDAGRRGYASVGVPRCGAFDRGAHDLANRLVGNAADAATIEITMGGFACRLLDAATIALTGAACAGLDWGTPTSVRAGSLIRLAAPSHGLRSYLAVRGGVAAEAVLGSRSSDTLSGLGPAPLRAGDHLSIGSSAQFEVSQSAAVHSERQPRLRVVLGPRAEWFTADSVQRLLATSWTVRADANRIGVRLDGLPLRRTRSGEAPTEPTLPGAIQVPPDGRPILLGPDAPVTGGYPVIGVVRRGDLDIAAQLRPGDSVSFS